MKTTILTWFTTIITILGCNFSENTEAKVEDVLTLDSVAQKATIPTAFEFSRKEILANIDDKKQKNQPLIVHVFVPLCDNENQGIVPVNQSLGNGTNLRTNLYWGAGYGISTHFKKHPKWSFLSSVKFDGNMLERIVFKHKEKLVFLIADAYRGDKMKACLTDYFQEIAGMRIDSFIVGENHINLGTNTDLVVFNGHNGLMDVYDLDTVYNQDQKQKDAIAIACASKHFFNRYLMHSGGYPLVMTADVLAPEAYVIDSILNAWLGNKTPEEIRFAAAQGYHSVQKCGINGASRLFVTGW